MALNAQDAVSAASSNEDTSEGASILKMGAERDSPASDDTSEGTFVAKTEDERGSPTDGKRGDGTKGSGSNEMFGDKVEGFSTRFLSDKWIGRYEATEKYVEYHNNEWRSLEEEDVQFIQQLWLEQEAAETQVVNGVKMKWNATDQEWQPVADQIDEDFIASYQANYGIPYDYSKLDEERKATEEKRTINIKADNKDAKKGRGSLEPQGWVDMEEKVHAVYVSNLPTDITMDEFKEFMSKCGVVQPDARTNQPKLKLYTDEEGHLKGDGRCCYIKKESVDLALSILDGYVLKGKEVHVEKARFELKGEFDPSKKRKKLSNAQKKRYMENQNRIFEWRPEKPRNYRPLSDCTVVIKNLFTLEMMERNAALLLDLKEEVQESCSKYGTVKKVVVYDNNPEGVVTVTFETTLCSDMAVKMLNGRIVDGRRLEVALWDGKTKYKIDESEEDRKRRLAAWENYIQGDDEEDNHNGKREATEGPEMRNFMAEKSQGNTAATRESFAFPQKRQKLTECAE